ncbi:hypothetical protein LOK49_LG06G01534 [Camellia lanceoleosa]|uniref:Uncharacterized protein n=1 Tax=Camellia lanceoleosa TaxID=1840588 RepID=A0ACC0HBG1_9ERIC|nr:hypothetical protein LOK49_LG06G01534 [Camellia lanceoleosa]
MRHGTSNLFEKVRRRLGWITKGRFLLSYGTRACWEVVKWCALGGIKALTGLTDCPELVQQLNGSYEITWDIMYLIKDIKAMSCCFDYLRVVKVPRSFVAAAHMEAKGAAG